MLREVSVRKSQPRTKANRRNSGIEAAILDAARQIVFHDGVEAMSARRIAKEVGCSAAAIYFYYRGIDDLLHRLRMEGHDILSRFLREAGVGLPPMERLMAMGRAYFRFGLEHTHYYGLMFHFRFK